MSLVGSAVQKEAAITGPVMWLTEEINAEFEGLTLIRVGLQGSLQLRTPPPSRSANKEIEFSFSLKETSGIKVTYLCGYEHLLSLSDTIYDQLLQISNHSDSFTC